MKTTFTEDALEICDRFGRTLLFSFDQKVKYGVSLCGKYLWLRGAEGKIRLDIPEVERKNVFLEFLRRCKNRNPDLAKKAAFDYLDAQKGFLKVAFIVSTFFCLPVAALMMNDSQSQYFCGKELHEASSLGTMQVTKVSKKRKGHYILDLELVLSNGEKIQGKDQVITLDETKIPKYVPVVFSPTHPQCWSLTPNLTQSEPNWAKQRYFAAFTFLFGLFFLTLGGFGLIWSVLRLRQVRPYQKEIRELFLLEQ